MNKNVLINTNASINLISLKIPLYVEFYYQNNKGWDRKSQFIVLLFSKLRVRLHVVKIDNSNSKGIYRLTMWSNNPFFYANAPHLFEYLTYLSEYR